MVDRVDFRENIKVNVLHVTKQELLEDFEFAPEIIQSGFYKHVYSSGFGQFGGEPIAAVLGAYEFKNTAPDMKLLQYVSAVGAMAHAPFLSSVSPEFMGLNSWTELPNIKDLYAIFEGPAYTKWRALRDSEDSRYLGLTAPRFLLRQPYSPTDNPVKNFNYYEDVSQNHEDYLWGNSLNPMIDAATPLLGMVMRLSTMNSQTMPEHLFAQVVTDVQAVEQLLQEQGYEPGVIISFRYILCTFIDEAALGNGWSNKNEWIKQSLLVHFHNEAWGGEKVFILLERLIREPKRYQDLLEFLWLCFSLGFRGRYKVAAQEQGEFEQIYRRLYHVLHKLRGNAPFPLLHQDKKTQGGRYQLISRLTIKHIFCGGVVVLALFYLFYLLRLDSQTQDILYQLNKLLR